MKVKATKVTELRTLDYVTEGKVYDVQDPTADGLGWVVDDVGDSIFIDFSDDGEKDAHGVKWEILE
jgi:hypothetical protein